MVEVTRLMSLFRRPKSARKVEKLAAALQLLSR